MRRTKIVATIGPASREPETLERMVEAGLDVARLNFSHGDRDIHAENASRVRAAAAKVGRQVAILQDLPGPKLRIGALRDDLAELKPGETLTLICGSTDVGDGERMSVSWAGLAEAVDPDDVIYLSDGAIRLRVKHVRVAGVRGRDGGRDRGYGGLAPGPEHPRLDARPGLRSPRRTSTCCASARRSGSTWWRCRSCAPPRTSTSCASTPACR